MKRASGAFLAIVTLIGMVFGGFLLSSSSSVPNSPSVDTSVLYRTFSPTHGSENASMKVVVFSDYLCPYCKDAHTTLNEIIAEYGDNIVVYYRNLIIHDEAEIFVRAALAGDKQGKFAEFDSVLFEREVESTEDAVVDLASEFGLDVEQFKSDLYAPDVENTILLDNEDAMALQVQGTPTIFLNDEQVEDFKTLSSVISQLL